MKRGQLVPALLLLGLGSGVVSLALSPAPARAEGERPTYMMVRCIKTTGGKGDEYKQFQLDTTGKAMQVRADEGNVAGWIFARAVIPSGGDSNCDFMQVNLHTGFPPERVPIDPYFAKAKVTVTREQWYAKLGEISRLARIEMWRGLEDLGQAEKGNYLRVDYLKVAPARAREWAGLVRAVARPAREAQIKEGVIKAWGAQQIVLPAGTGEPYSARTVTVFPGWDAIGRDLEREDRGAAKAAERLSKVEELVRSELYEIVAVVRPSKPAAAAK
jgi:hypothetical protein